MAVLHRQFGAGENADRTAAETFRAVQSFSHFVFCERAVFESGLDCLAGEGHRAAVVAVAECVSERHAVKGYRSSGYLEYARFSASVEHRHVCRDVTGRRRAAFRVGRVASVYIEDSGGGFRCESFLHAVYACGHVHVRNGLRGDEGLEPGEVGGVVPVASVLASFAFRADIQAVVKSGNESEFRHLGTCEGKNVCRAPVRKLFSFLVCYRDGEAFYVARKQCCIVCSCTGDIQRGEFFTLAFKNCCLCRRVIDV